MALAALIAAASHATLAEALRAEYRAPTDAEVAANPALKDHMLLDVTPTQGFGLDNVAQLKQTVGTEKARADKAEGELAPFKELKVKPAEVATKLERLGELEKIDPNTEADRLAEEKAKGIKEQLVSAHNDEKKGWQDREKVLLGVVDEAKRTAAATKAIIDAGGDPEVLLPHVLGSTRLVEKDGKFEVVVVDGAGNPRIGDASGGNMTLDGLVGELKAKDSFAPLFQASGATGGGAQPKGPGGGPKNTTVRSKADLGDLNAKAEFIDKHGSDAYLALPNEAAA